MKIKVYTIRAFSRSAKGGNLAGVVASADYLSSEQMQSIAKAVGYSETAFVSNGNSTDFNVRFFTPSDEVDLCGHATIATYSVLFKLGIIGVGHYKQSIKAGVLDVTVNEDSSVYMTQVLPTFYEVLTKKEIVASLGIKEIDIVDDLPIQIVSTGLKDVMIPVKTRTILNGITADFEKIAAISSAYDVVGYHVFCLGNAGQTTAYCRNFAPRYGIDEESATGSSSGALACYLQRYKMLHDTTQPLLFQQGECMHQPSEIQTLLKVKNGEVSTVAVGGYTAAFDSITVKI